MAAAIFVVAAPSCMEKSGECALPRTYCTVGSCIHPLSFILSFFGSCVSPAPDKYRNDNEAPRPDSYIIMGGRVQRYQSDNDKRTESYCKTDSLLFIQVLIYCLYSVLCLNSGKKIMKIQSYNLRVVHYTIKHPSPE